VPGGPKRTAARALGDAARVPEMVPGRGREGRRLGGQGGEKVTNRGSGRREFFRYRGRSKECVAAADPAATSQQSNLLEGP
jgi:hypothetical protein